MLVELRAAVVAKLDAADTPVGFPPKYPTIPDNPAHHPCIVVARPTARREEGNSYDLDLEVFLVARRTSDESAEVELVDWADTLLEVLAGPSPAGHIRTRVESAAPRLVDVAGNITECYVVTVGAAAALCP